MFRSSQPVACLLATAPAAPRIWTANEGGASLQGESSGWIFAQRTPLSD